MPELWQPELALDLQSLSQLYCSHSPLFLAGRYNKFTREMSQTPWMIDDQRKGSTSLQEEICLGMAKVIGSDVQCFHSGGREDIDVRMLG